jgi:MYXO-CTERM domain-containing protein
LVILFPAASARAQTTGNTFSGNIIIDIRLPNPNGGQPFLANAQQQLEFFNRARCHCPDAVFYAFVRMTNPPPNLPAGIPAQIWVGTNCSADLTRAMQCEHIMNDIADIRTLLSGQISIPIPVAKLAYPITTSNPTNMCMDTVVKNSVFVLVDVNMNGTNMTPFSTQVGVDAQLPSEVGNIQLAGGQNAIVTSWSPPSTNPENIGYYQMLCARADGSVSPDDHLGGTANYLTPNMQCDGSSVPSPDPPSFPKFPMGLVNGAPVTDSNPIPPLLNNLDPSTICQSATGGTNTSMRAEGLENGVSYRVVLLVIDKSFNPLPLDLGEVTPIPTIDFWEEYHNAGGTAVGGFGCSSAAGSTGEVGLFYLAALLALGARWRKRRTPPSAFAAVLVLVLSSSVLVSAQPYIEDEPPDPPKGPPVSHWNVGVKIGPYYPDIDKGFSGVRPFHLIYGSGPFIMAKADVDWYFLFPRGQFGLTASLGFLHRTAQSFVDDGTGQIRMDPTTGGPMRSAGDQTSFTLIPTSIGVVYRYTDLDERYHIPLVPYAKLALAYYFWWTTDPNGNIASASTQPGCDINLMPCPSTRGLGAITGIETVLGLSFRAEHIDKDTAATIHRELGIDHIGLFAEFFYADVNNFGIGDKLSVGALTFFGGINFEF